MSEFSNRLEREIKHIHKPLRYLAEASGLQLDYISKMSRGKRIPQDEEWLNRLLDAMECVPGTRRELLQLYRQEKMGKVQWNCMQELIRMIGQDVLTHPQTGGLPAGMKMEGKKAVQGREEVYLCLRGFLAGCAGKQVRIWTVGIEPEPMEELLRMLGEAPAEQIEHILSLRQNRDEMDTLENLKRIRLVKQKMFCRNYHPFFYYLVSGGEQQLSPLSNWFIGENRAMGTDDSMEHGIVLEDAAQIQVLKDLFARKKQMTRPLVSHLELSEYMHDVNEMMNSGYVTRNYYIEQSPCLLHLIPLNILKEQLTAEGKEQERLLTAIQMRTSHMKYEEMVHIFSMEGIRFLMEEGRITGYPDALYQPLPVPLRRWLLKRYYQYMQASPHSCVCVREDSLRLPRHLSIVSSSNVDNGIAFWNSTEEGLQYYVIRESGISRKLYEFCRFLENGNMAYSAEETLEMLGRMI